MDAEEDYFGHVTAPEGTEEEDAANDLTFGDLGDIKAGDPESEAVWSLNHEALAVQIEREKEALLKAQDEISRSSPIPLAQHTVPLQGYPPHMQNLHPQDPIVQPLLAHGARLPVNPEGAPHNSAYMQHWQQAHQYTMMQQQQQAMVEQHRRMLAVHYLQQEEQRRMMLHHEMQRHLKSENDALSHKHYTAGPNGNPPRPPPVTASNGIAQGAMTLEDIERRILSRQGTTSAQTGSGPEVHQIEHHMSATGLASSSGNIQDQTRVGSKPDWTEHVKATPRSGKARPPVRPGHSTRGRLESMTDRDLEVVLRMHLKQLETSVPYKDDYYAFALLDRDSYGSADAFSGLSVIVNEMDDSALRNSNGRKYGPKGARPRPKGARGEVGHGVALDKAAAHAPGHISTLANALGALQVWNPKAPRKLVDFAGKQGDDSMYIPRRNSIGVGGLESSRPMNDQAGPIKLLRDDDRIAVRSAVEHGYDIIASIHDVARRKNVVPLEPLIWKLFSLFQLQTTNEESSEEKVSTDAVLSDGFFVRMCGFPKGMLFVSRALILLRPMQKRLTVCCIMRNLSTLVTSSINEDDDASAYCGQFWSAVNSIIGDPAMHALAAVSMLAAFDDGHRADRELVTIAAASVPGALLIYSAMQRIFCDINGGALEADEPELIAMMTRLLDTILESLGDIFERTDSSSGVWQVSAMLDALASRAQQGKLRNVLKQLLDDGRAPAPPA